MDKDIAENQSKPIKKKKGLSIASLIFGIIGTAPLLSTASIVAIILGHISLSKIKKSSGKYSGKGLAIAGLILGYLGLSVAITLGIMRGVLKNELGY